MSVLDLENLLQPVSPDSPCGENLEYEAEFIAVDTASRGKPEQEYGDTKIPAEPPEWGEVVRIGIPLLQKTKDLRVACLVARGLLALQGIQAFCEGLELIWGFVDQHWSHLHPELDPDDDNDPTLRINTISSLNDYSTTIVSLRQAPLVESGMLGKFSLVDIEIAKGAIPTPEDVTDPPSTANIDAAFEQAGVDALSEKLAAVDKCNEMIRALEQRVTEAVGADRAASFAALVETMGKIKAALTTQGERLGMGAESESAEMEEMDAAEGEAAATSTGDPADTARAPAAPPGEIRSREDVIKTLDRLCRYYEKYEPSSPLPLLLGRAKRLATMSFLDIVEELTPEGLVQAKAAGGVREDDVQ